MDSDNVCCELADQSRNGTICCSSVKLAAIKASYGKGAIATEAGLRGMIAVLFQSRRIMKLDDKYRFKSGRPHQETHTHNYCGVVWSERRVFFISSSLPINSRPTA